MNLNPVFRFTIISLAIFLYTVLSSGEIEEEEKEEVADYHEDTDNGNPNEKNNIFGTDLLKFLEDVDDDALLNDEEAYVGRANNETYCYTHDQKPYNYFSTKTQYPKHNKSHNMDPVPGCEITYVWIVMRHGVRYGSSGKTLNYYGLGKMRDDILKNAGEKKTELCIDDLFSLLLWTPLKKSTGDLITPDSLSENGYILLKKFGDLLRNKFPHLIPIEYDEKIMKIEYSNETKVTQSVEALTDALFGKPFLTTFDPQGLLEHVYEKPCRRPSIRDSQTGLNYTYLTQSSDFIKHMVEDVSHRLGFDEDQTLPFDEVENLYNGCQYEIAWGSEKSPWCAAFSKDDLKMMEYIGDISYFYFCGPGDIYNYFQGCILLKDMVNRLMDAASDNPKGEKMNLYLGHSTTLLLLITQLGLTANDKPLTHKNYFEQLNRKWRTSLLAPYTGNFIAIMHKCSTDPKYRVKFLLNEEPIKFNDICDENYLCPIEDFYKIFEPIITSEECSTKYCTHTADEMCRYLNYDEEQCEILRKQLFEKDKEIEMKLKRKNFFKYVSQQMMNLLHEYKYACVLVIICTTIIFMTLCSKFMRRFYRNYPRIFRRRINETKTKDKQNGKEIKAQNNNATENKKEGKTKLKTINNKNKTENKQDDKRMEEHNNIIKENSKVEKQRLKTTEKQVKNENKKNK